jgi:hypothetical protein
MIQIRNIFASLFHAHRRRRVPVLRNWFNPSEAIEAPRPHHRSATIPRTGLFWVCLAGLLLFALLAHGSSAPPPSSLIPHPSSLLLPP